MKPELVEDVARIVKISWSFWAQIAGLILLMGGEVLYALTGIDFDPRITGYAGIGLLIFGIVARAFKQTGSTLRNWMRFLAVVIVIVMASIVAVQAKTPGQCDTPCVASQAQTMTILLPLVQKWEGTRLVAYRDVVGIPTICTGSTRGVKMGMTKTQAECDALLRSELIEYRAAVQRGFSVETITYRLPPERDAAFADLGYNVGPPTVRTSTATRRLNAGNVPGACVAIGWFNKAGGRIWRGIVLRRNDDRALCRVGL